VSCDGVLFALGRKPRTTGFGLEDLGVALTASGHIEVNDYLQTNYHSLYAVGDVAGPYQFTHTASHMAWYAAVNALFGTFKRFKVDYRVVPWCTFSSPEVARVGLNETEANAAGLAFETTRFDVAELDRAKADDARQGFVKVLTVPGSDKILGVTIVSEHAGETISEFVLAMKYNLGLKKIMGTIHIYPTWSEMNKFAAGVWRRANKPERFMPLLAWYHRIRRGGG
jgi:pyruvate/2-oxoglutarate dehydrogenase complex dihydrolipoamide dehydrogenase (E3) component